MRRTPPAFLHHWRAKLGSLLLATALWLVIKHGISYSPALPPVDPPPPPPPSVPADSRP